MTVGGLMNTQSDRRLIAAAGILGVLILLAAQGMVWNAPTIEKPPAGIRAWARDHRSLALVAGYLLVAGFAVQLVFWVGVWQQLRSGERGGGLLNNAGLAGIIFLTAVGAVAFAFAGELAFRGSQLSDDAARMLNDLTFLTVAVADIATALAVGAFSIVIVRDKPLPIWLGWFGLATALLHLVAGGAFAREGFFSPQGIGIYVTPILYYVWVVAASVLIWRTSDSTTY